jgi:hypothetical protein
MSSSSAEKSKRYPTLRTADSHDADGYRQNNEFRSIRGYLIFLQLRPTFLMTGLILDVLADYSGQLLRLTMQNISPVDQETEPQQGGKTFGRSQNRNEIPALGSRAGREIY